MINPKLQNIFKRTSNIGFVCLIAIPILLLINKDFFGQGPFAFLYGLIGFVAFGSRACHFVITGEAVAPWKIVKRTEKPFLYYFEVVLHIVVAVFFLSPFIIGLIQIIENKKHVNMPLEPIRLHSLLSGKAVVAKRK